MGLSQPDQVNYLQKVSHSCAQAAIAAVPTHRQSLEGTWPDLIASWRDYLIDAVQRSVLSFDLPRQRRNEKIKIISRPIAALLSFDCDAVIDGSSLPRPTNHTLPRIVDLPGVVTELQKRAVVVLGARAGRGPGFGGFKADSEIGDALNAGHPVYFTYLGAIPAPGQQFLDAVEGQASFFERVVAFHPDARRPFAIGNCQAGYQTLMVAILRPDLFDPCRVAGAPMSDRQGVYGNNPMRDAGGLPGDSWLTVMTAYLGAGRIDGTRLILNFDRLNSAYWLWGKQYEDYAQVDTTAAHRCSAAAAVLCADAVARDPTILHPETAK